MAIITNDHGEFLVDDDVFDDTVRVLMLSELNPTKPAGADLNVGAAYAGLEGGEYVTTPEQLYEKYELRVQSRKVKLRVDGHEEKPELAVDFKANSARSFTGIGIKTQVAKDSGEVNDVAAAWALLSRVLDQMQDDFTADASERKKARAQVAEALKGLAQRFKEGGEQG